MASPNLPRKRNLDDEEDFQDIASLSQSKSAKVHGYIQSLSPIKQSSSGSSKYFTCEVTDGTSSRRAVGFDNKIQLAFMKRKCL